MPLDWRETHTGEDKPRNIRYRVLRRDGKIIAEDQTNLTQLEGDFKTYDDAKKACEEAYKALPEGDVSPQAAAEPQPAPKAPEPPKPASAPPAPAHRPSAHQPPHKGTRR